jgi:hypothetical protein
MASCGRLRTAHPTQALWPRLEARQRNAPCARSARLIIAAGGWLALRPTGNLTDVFIALSITLAAFELINAAGVAGGTWFASDERPQKASTESIRNERVLF